ncbi:MAG TPA: hypothetical protein VFC78_03160 [Tepidisphaeraceae bacterium]|nr:hypothetical protein [Tepidisphaeraceae bacterium]
MADRSKAIRRPDGGATDQVGEGPRGIEGAEASELPDHGRSDIDTDFGKQAARKLPGQIGGLIGDGTDVGIAGEPDVADAREHGGHGHN